MKLERSALKKWTKITLICGAHSFVWGLMAGSRSMTGTVIAMLLGLATLTLMFAAIESHSFYQTARSRDALLAKALDLGVKIRIWFAVSIPVFFILGFAVPPVLAISPATAEISIGAFSLYLTQTFTGFAPEKGGRADDVIGVSFVDNFCSIYLTTMITGIIHTALLAALCGLVYAWFRFRKVKA
ncbi:MAG: hypothetical protein J0L97_07195 [Alphaproteobacteria bacterium]|nr:hypothetical protein [Alphaproteobacteria bacterium]